MKLASEVATFSEPMRQVLADGVRDWRKPFEQLIGEGQRKGVIRKDADPTVVSALIMDLWMGASQRAQLERNVSPLRGAATFIRSYLAA